MASSDSTALPTSIKAIERPVNLIPVALKEAALDSPTFRATAVHFAEQLELVERWLDSCARAASKLTSEVNNLESLVNGFLSASAPPIHVSESVIDHDYTLLALKRYGEGARESWNRILGGLRRMEAGVAEPIRAFLNGELRTFKETRRAMEANQKNFDGLITRYMGQGKSKEPSSLREDAFQVHEARKAYLRTSMDFCATAPQVRASLDKLLVRVFAEQWREMRMSREASQPMFARLGAELERVRGWSREMENSERAFKRELAQARKQIEENALIMTKPSRELADYEVSTVPYLGIGASLTNMAPSLRERGEKQSWLLLKTVVGKPARTMWSKRWFYVKNGIFGWLIQGSRSGGVEESEKIGVLLCSVRPAFTEERRFCFEVKTSDTTFILQAEMQTELTEWLNAFDIAKRKALDDPSSTSVTGPALVGVDPAFSILPPVAPEFAARVEGHGDQKSDEGGQSVLSVSDRDTPGVPTRASFDVSAGRRVTSGERELGEGTRDHAARIMQKLDLAKRSTGSTTAAVGGIASLISASHIALPVSPVTGLPTSTASTVDGASSVHKRNFSNPIPTSTLAPSTLASPPAPTNLSQTAVIVSGERGIGLGSRADGSGMPSGLMANLWGSFNWGYVNRLADDPAQEQRLEPLITPAEASTSTSTLQTSSIDDVGIIDGTGEMSKDISSVMTSLAHRKTVSVPGTADAGQPPKMTTTTHDITGKDEYPNYYPLPLKAQYAQFRMLFPSVPRSEKIVLVFRATWNPNEQQEFPGRVYVTTREIYFYSHHLGLVLITGVSLSSISDVTAAPGRDCDFLYLHLKEGREDGTERKRITVRVFLDSMRLLQRRLDFLVRNASAPLAEQPPLEEVLKTLIKMEIEKPERSSSADSWEELRVEDANGANEGEAKSSPGKRKERNVKAAIRIDGNLYGEPAAKTGRELQKFQLPRQAVVYAPQGMQMSITREFNVSAKALFHLIFGDKSAVFQALYCNRWADKIVQTPWTKAENGVWTRRFNSEAYQTPRADLQRIDIYNDHLCYVITNTKTPWRLPYSRQQRFYLTTKIVITYVGKSRSKLAIFQAVQWARQPRLGYFRHLVERQALNSLEADALDLTNVAMDQVTKLGTSSKTSRAVEIFGGIGQQTVAVAVMEPAQMPGVGSLTSATRRKPHGQIGLPRLVMTDVMARLLGMVSMTFDVLIAIGKGTAGVLTAHTILVMMLAVSGVYNTWYGYRDSQIWWHERSARKYMAHLGVHPNRVMSRAVFLRDIEEFIVAPLAVENYTDLFPTHLTESSMKASSMRTCRTTFTDQVLTTSTSTPTSLSGPHARLQRSRESLAGHRHDLLVALRVVNRVERDVVLAEWEDWVRAEQAKCERVESLLRSRELKSGKSPGDQPDGLDAGLGEEFHAYCASCRRDAAALPEGVALI